MKFKTTMIAVASLLSLNAVAAPVTPEQALARVSGNGPAKVRSFMSAKPKLAYTARDLKGNAAAYVFTTAADEGFTILSADDRAIPVLGYSDSGKFDPKAMPPAMKWWLEEYGRQLEYAAARGASKTDAGAYAPEGWRPVAPMITTKWNQDAPYNDKAPKINDVNCPTGCAATSLAQAMNYFKYPDQGTGTIAYQWKAGKRTLRMNFETFKPKWDLMLDEYTKDSPEDNKDAVATLMKACGYAIEMEYNSGVSGAVSYKIVDALINNFKYDAGTEYVDRSRIPAKEWYAKVYNNLSKVGPIIYNGSSIEGGHSFICDGYDGNGYYHINWGWGGLSDGYYSLDMLSPDAQGTGGTLGGYNYSQDAVFNMQKPTGKPVEPLYATFFLYGNASFACTGNTLTLSTIDADPEGFATSIYRASNIYPGISIKKADGTGDEIVIKGMFGRMASASFTVPYSYFPSNKTKPTFTLPSDLENGDYKVTFLGKDVEYDEAPWIPAETVYGYSNYCWLTVKDGQFTVKNASPALIQYENVTMPSSVYYTSGYSSRNVPLRATLRNDTGLELTQCIQVALKSGTKTMLASDYFLVTVQPGETVEKEWPVKLFTVDGSKFEDGKEYELWLEDAATKQTIGKYGTVKVEKIGSITTVQLEDMKINNAEKGTYSVGDKEFADTYFLNSMNDVQVAVTVKVTRGYFDSQLNINIFKYDPATDTNVDWRSGAFHDRPFLQEGETGTVTGHIDMDGAEEKALYVAQATYNRGAIGVNLGRVYFSFTDGAGVEDVIAEEEEAVYYNMQGVRVDNPQPGQILIVRKGGKTHKVIF